MVYNSHYFVPFVAFPTWLLVPRGLWTPNPSCCRIQSRGASGLLMWQTEPRPAAGHGICTAYQIQIKIET